MGEPGGRERVTAVLDALREGLGAEAIGLFDDDRAESGPGGPRSAVDFWGAFDDLALGCVNVDWPTWYAELRASESVETACACGAHRLNGRVIHGRWVLLTVTPAAAAPGAALAVSSALTALAASLPPPRVRSGFDQDAGEARPSAGTPLWWVRKARE